MDFAQRLQEIIDEYNAGGSSTENYFADLMNFAENIQEDTRHVREGLTEDELELYDTLRKDTLTEHPKVLVQGWWKDGQTQRIVKAVVEDVLDQGLPESYDRITFKEKSDKVFDLIVSFAANGRKWAA